MPEQEKMRGYWVWVCPACGKQVSDSMEPDGEGGYSRGHYHSPPSDDWSGPDPWFDARRILTVGLHTSEELGADGVDDESQFVVDAVDELGP